MTELDIDVNALIDHITRELRSRPVIEKSPKMIGIRTGGEWVAQALHDRLQLDAPLGVLDISFYRDDFSKIGLNPAVKPSDIPWEVDGQHIILVDDVLFTGRTIRAAMNEIFDFGRPASITLVTLLERRGCRELPIQADVVGQVLACSQTLKVSGPEPLTVSIVDHSKES